VTRIPLASVIRALRSELGDAVRAQTGEEIGFALGPVELELQVDVSQEAGAEAGIKFWLVAIGGKGTRSSGSTQTVRLQLTPRRRGHDDEPLVVEGAGVRPD
jgi:hypothetical protein